MSTHSTTITRPWRRLLIPAAGGLALALPLALGALDPPVRAQAAPTFEVASIKPNKGSDGRVGMMMQPGGRYTATNVTLAMLISNAYQLQGGRGGGPGAPNPQIINAPSWINTERYDITAKADADVQPNQFPELLKSLLADRFKLAAHKESREFPVYDLMLARADGKLGPALKPVPADCAAMIAARGRGGRPGGPGGAGERGGPGGPGAGARGPIAPPEPGQPMPCGMMRFGPGNMVSGGTDVAQIASSLTPWVGRNVVDKTGLTAGYAFELKWTPEQMPQGGGPPPGSGIPPIDPNGPSIFTAVQEQLGLKLESSKGPVDVVVIDHVEQPTPD